MPPSAQQQQPPRSQYQFIPSGQSSVANSVPPSRDPIKPLVGGGAGSSQATGPSPQVGTPTMTIQAPQQNAPVNSAVTTSGGVVGGATGGTVSGATGGGAVGGGAQAYAETAVKDSLPIASEELVERLEEISTQQGSPDAAEDPER